MAGKFRLMKTPAVVNRIVEEAKNGDPFAQVMYGYLLENGFFESADVNAARIWYEHAARRGFPPGQYAWALCERRDKAAAHDWLEKAAKGGYAPAHFALGCAYLVEDPDDDDFNAAIGHFKSASNRGYVPAMMQLSTIYGNPEHTVVDIALALEYAKQAAEAGSNEGATWYGMLATEHGDKQQKLQGLKWLEKADESGDKAASSVLSGIYWAGQYGVTKDQEKARYYIERAEGDNGIRGRIYRLYFRVVAKITGRRGPPRT